MASYVKCCFYGSLRKDLYNNERIKKNFGNNSDLYIRTVDLPGFKMYNISGGYPALCRDDRSSTVVAEVHYLSKDSYEFVKAMERSAGYYEDVINVGDDQCSIFLMKKDQVEDYPVVETGDWRTAKFTYNQ